MANPKACQKNETSSTRTPYWPKNGPPCGSLVNPQTKCRQPRNRYVAYHRFGSSTSVFSKIKNTRSPCVRKPTKESSGWNYILDRSISAANSQECLGRHHSNTPAARLDSFLASYQPPTIFLRRYGVRGVDSVTCYYFPTDAGTWKAIVFSCSFNLWDSRWGARHANHDNCIHEFKAFRTLLYNTHRTGIDDRQTLSTSHTSHDLWLRRGWQCWRRRSSTTFSVMSKSSENTFSICKTYHESGIFRRLSPLGGPEALLPCREIHR